MKPFKLLKSIINLIKIIKIPYIIAFMLISFTILLNLDNTDYRKLISIAPPSLNIIRTEEKNSNQSTSGIYETSFSPSLATSLQNTIFHSGTYPSSSTCANCHVTLHKNWQGSLHSQAARDPWYLKVKDLLAFEEGELAVRQCAGCHAPVALMIGEVGLYSAESASSQEGVSCAFCHTLDSVKGGDAQWVSDPGRIRPYPGGDYLSEAGIQAAAHLVMAEPQQHREDMIRPFYRSSEFCQGCHELSMNGVQLQSTFSEWAKSSYADQGVTCQGCHFTPGAGQTSERGRLVDHRPPERDGVYLHTLGGGSLTVASRNNRPELSEALSLKAQMVGKQLQVTVRNVKGGHSIPTGVSDLRELWVEVTATDAAGQTVFTSGHLDPAGHIREGSQIFNVVFGDENGNKIVRHDIWRIRSVLSDTRIPADGARVVKYDLPAQATAVKVRLLWRDAPADFQQIVVQGATLPAEVYAVAEWSSGQ